MNYVVFDMEWNDTTPKVKNDKGIILNHEIIQMGAAKINEKLEITDTFKVNIKPKIYEKIRDQVTELTGITELDLKDGLRVHEAMEKFRSWCGENFIFLTWGSEDIPVLCNNLDFFRIDRSWVPFYFNAQAIFNMQTENKGRAYSLEYAMEFCGVHEDCKMHDALNDAVCTAKVCAGFDIETGIVSCDEYDGVEFGRIDVPLNMRREISLSYKTIKEAMDDGFADPVCPECGLELDDIIWYRAGENKIIADGYCPKHDDYAVIITRRKLSDKVSEIIKSTYIIDRINEAYFDFVENRSEEIEKEDI